LSRIFLIRHGETAANAARIFQTPGVPLSELGRGQARRLARRLAGAGVRQILASDLLRAVETAEALRDATGAPLALDPLLQERSFGELRGRPYAEVGGDPFAADYVPPGGESWEAFHHRVAAAFGAIESAAARADGPVAVVTHGLVCGALVARHLGPPDDAPARVGGFPNACLTVAEGPSPWRVTLLACTAHLGPRPERAGGEA
jgi:probable phosphoglycerate mutase